MQAASLASRQHEDDTHREIWVLKHVRRAVAPVKCFRNANLDPIALNFVSSECDSRRANAAQWTSESIRPLWTHLRDLLAGSHPEVLERAAGCDPGIFVFDF